MVSHPSYIVNNGLTDSFAPLMQRVRVVRTNTWTGLKPKGGPGNLIALISESGSCDCPRHRRVPMRSKS